MRKLALLALASVALVCGTTQAQRNSAASLLDSPVKCEALPGGAVVPGSTIPLPAGSLWAEAVVDDNQGGQILCIDDLGNDVYACIDAAASGAFICSYVNADLSGPYAFGNSIGDAVSPSECSGATLIQATGTRNEGQVTRVGQYDCNTTDPACSDRWDVGSISTFVNGVEEFDLAGRRHLAIVDNASLVFLIIANPIGIRDCQDIDPEMDLVFVNGSQGSANHGYNVDVDHDGTLSVGVQRAPASNGRFVYHLNAGAPSAGTVSPLLDLGNPCFEFLGGSPVVIENNAGRNGRVGPSSYFGTPVLDPSRAPTFLQSLLQAHVDTANLPVGSRYTHQSIHISSAASSSRGASLSNAVVMTIR